MKNYARKKHSRNVLAVRYDRRYDFLTGRDVSATFDRLKERGVKVRFLLPEYKRKFKGTGCINLMVGDNYKVIGAYFG